MVEPIIPPAGGFSSNNNINMSAECLDRFARNFEASSKRWELIVYPSLFAFIVLASYFFFLIYRLTSDVASMARSVSEMTASVDRMSTDMHLVSNNMNEIAFNMNELSRSLQSVSLRMETVSGNMESMTIYINDISQRVRTLEPMLDSIHSLDKSTRAMTVYTDHMRHSVSGLNRGINQAATPMQMMTTFMPVRW